jgi:hypothetical protein
MRIRQPFGMTLVTTLVVMTCAANTAAQTHTTTPTQSAAKVQKLPIRYLDVTARNDGWVLAQSLGVSGSSEHKLAIISYMEPAMTRTFYDVAVSFTRPPYTLPIFGVVRAPQHPTEPNANGFDIYINGVTLGEIKDEVIQRVYSKPALLRALLENIQKDDRR